MNVCVCECVCVCIQIYNVWVQLTVGLATVEAHIMPLLPGGLEPFSFDVGLQTKRSKTKEIYGMKYHVGGAPQR